MTLSEPLTTGARSAAIIGGGPAGCSTAIHLARRGWNVTLIEAKAFPRVKVCGEFVSPAATGVLEDLLPPAELLAAGARRVETFALDLDDRALSWRMPAPAWVLSRRSLDDLLAAAALRAGVNLRQPERVRRVEYADDRVTLRLDAGDLSPDVVVHADASGRHDPAGPTPNRPGVVGQKCHFRPPRCPEGIRMRSCRGVYIGSVGVEDGEATLALVARSDVLKRNAADTDAMVRALWPDYDPAWRTTEWLSCGVAASGFIPAAHPRSFRAGNAAAAVEPVGGEGIGLALWAGRALAESLSDAPDLRVAAQRYAARYRRRLRARRPACRAAAELLMRPRLLRALWPALELGGVRGAVIHPWYALTGKG